MLPELESVETNETPTSDSGLISATPFLSNIKIDTFQEKENKMAEVDTFMLSNQHSDIRREAVEHTNEIVKEGLKATAITDAAVKDARYEVSSRIDSSSARTDMGFAQLADRFFTVARDTADLRAQVIQAIDTTKLSTELNALKGIIEGQKNTTYLSDKITADGEKTRDLISDLKYHDLNRTLVERNAELVGEREGHRWWRHHADQGQWAVTNNQLQALQSQLQETRQGMVNFGTMAGVGQTSTSNNVR